MEPYKGRKRGSLPYLGDDTVYRFFPVKQERIGSRQLPGPSPHYSNQNFSPFSFTSFLSSLSLFSDADNSGGTSSTSMKRSGCVISSCGWIVCCTGFSWSSYFGCFSVCCHFLGYCFCFSPVISAVAAPSLAAAAAFVAASPAISAVATPSLAATAASTLVVVVVAAALAITHSPAAALAAVVSWQLLFPEHRAEEAELSPSLLFSQPQSTSHWRPS